MSTNYSPTIVTDGIVGNWDPKVREYPPRGIATTWTDYSSNSAHYTILGDDGVILKDSSAGWIGYFPAIMTSLGGYTMTFDVVADSSSTFEVNNDQTSNNAFLKTISVGTTLTRITLKGTITSISVPLCQVFLKRTSGGNITITNFRLFQSGPWLYDSAGGSDGRGSGNNGLMHNGTCLAFDGTDDRIELDDLDSQFSDYFTLSVWLRPLAVTGETWVFAGENGGGIGFYIRQSNDDLIFRHNGIGDGTTNVTAFFSYSEANQAAPVSTAWIHCVFNWDGVNTNVYRDGVRVGGEAATGTLAADAFNDPRIGDDSAAGDREWYGEMADFRLYNVALSASQVTEIYNDSKVIIPSNVSQANLIVWYPMTEGAGDLVYDGSGKGYTGTFSNAPTWTTAQTGPPQLVEGYNRPMLFDGSNDYVQVASDGRAFGNQSFTISAWVNMPDVTPSGQDRVIFSYDYTAHSQPYYAMHLRVAATSGALEFYWNNGSTYVGITKSSPPLTANTWHHVAAVHANGSQQLYIDGAQVASGTDTGTISFYNQEVWIGYSGNFNSGSGGGYWDGLINETIVYNSALSLAQVQALAATGPNGGPLPPDPMSLSNSSDVVGYWRNDGITTWKNRGPQVVKNFTGVATDPINDSNSVGSWTNNGTSLTSVVGGRTGFIDGAMRVAPRYRFLFDSAINCTVNSIISVTSGKSYKVSAWFKGGTSTTARLIVTGGYYDSGNFTASSTVWTNKTDIFTATSTGNVTVELHNRAAGTMYFDDVTLVESGPAFDGTVYGSPASVLFKQGINGSASTSTGRDNQGFPLKQKNVGAVGFDADATDNYINIADSAELDNIWDGGGTTDTWIYPASDGESDGGRIYEKTQWNLLTHSQSGDNVKLQFYFKFTGTDGTWDTDVVVPINEWSNIVVTYDADDVANTPTIYINGVAYTVGDGLTASTTPTGAREDDDGEDLQIGNNDTPSRTFDGQISGLKMYNRVLSQAEIQQNMNAQRSRFA